MLRVHLFAGLSLTWHDEPLPVIPSRTARSLGAYLITYRDRPHTRDLLAGTFWPDLPDAVARRRLSQALWRIRSTLEPCPLLLAEGDTIQLNPDLPLWLDVEEFELRARSDGQYERLTHDEQLVDLYRGDFLAGIYDDWLLPERERLREIYLAALVQLAEGHKVQGEYERALIYARRLVGEDPWREETHREVMRLYHVLGRDQEALKQFETCRQALAEELGVTPSPETVDLAREIAIQNGEPAPPVLPEFPPSPAALLLDDPDAPELPLVGREAERTALLGHVEALLQGLGGIVLVEGEAGVGKTRLLQAVESDAAWRGVEVLRAGGQDSGAMTPYGPLLAALNEGISPLRASQLAQVVDEIWLRVLAALLPALAGALPHLPPPPKLDPAQEQDRLAAALARLLAGWAQIAPLLLILEDLHWAGEDALDLLVRLAPSLSGHAVLLVGSYRSEEARAQEGTWLNIQALDRAGVRQKLALSGLDAATAGELIRRSLGMGSPAPLFESRLHQETQGNPLFLLETLRALHGEGLLSRDQDGQWSTPWDETTDDYAELPLPRAVEQTISRRLAMLPPALEQTIRAAAVLGERFDFALLRAASKKEPAALLAALRDLVQRRFVDETDQEYRFSHDKIRQAAYKGIGEPERLQLHRQAAEAFEAHQPDRAAALSYHWTRAKVWDRSADYQRQAGDRARAVYANVRATEHYGRALEAMERLPGPPDLAGAFELRLNREAIYGVQGDRAMQVGELAALETLAEQMGDDRRRAQIALRQAEYAEATSDFAAAIAAAQVAIGMAQKTQEVELEAAGNLEWGVALWRQGEHAAARPRLERALILAKGAGLRQLEVDSLRNTGTMYFLEGDYAGAKLSYEQALVVGREIGDRRGEASAVNNLGLVFENQGNNAVALARYEQALHIYAEIGFREGEGMALGNVGNTARSMGDYARAIDHYEQALINRREVNNREGEGIVLHNMGMILDELGDYAAAREYHQQALSVFRDLGDQWTESQALTFMGLLLHHMGDDQAAREVIEQALLMAQDHGYRHTQAFSLTYLGHALAGQGHLAQAADAYQQGLDIRRALGEQNLVMESLAGLARVSLAQNDLSQAQTYVGEILAHLEQGTLDGINEPFLIYLTCYRVLHAAQNPHATNILTQAHTLLQQRAANLEGELQRCYLEHVAAHRELVAAYHELQGRRVQVRLPHAGVPATRPPNPDEWVDVTWTVEAPEDAEIPGKAARRRRQLLRLLDQAAAQAAAPTVQDLAAALKVSPATLKRDLAALRQEGFEPQTRGSRK